MIPLTVARIAELVGGTLHQVADPSAVVTGPVVVDSRQVKPGSLFVAIAGERLDGHDYVARASQAGAVVALVSRPVDAAAIVVADVQVALGRLAHGVLAELDVPVVGITGSAGKTSTKDVMAQVLAQRGPVVAPPGSFNNEWGLPLTVLKATHETTALVLEFGARGIGHIRTLTDIARPQLGVVLNVGTAHLGEFGDADTIARAKGELVEALPAAAAGGVAVLNADDPRVAAMASRTPARVIFVSRDPDRAHATPTVWAEQVSLDEQARPRFTLAVQGEGAAPVKLNLHGDHHVSNALAVAGAAHAWGMSVDLIAQGLSSATAQSRWRMELTHRADGVTVVNDAYNANPDSMKAAITAVATMAAGRPGSRCWAVLGEMRELGEISACAHADVGRQLAEAGFAGVVVVGEATSPIMDGAHAVAGWTGVSVMVADEKDSKSATREITALVRPGDIVLVKASRSIGLERVAVAVVEANPA